MSSKRERQKQVHLLLSFSFVLMHDHACDKIRTRDLLVRSQTLYPAELRAHSAFSNAGIIILGTKADVKRKIQIFGILLFTRLAAAFGVIRRF